MKTHGPLNVDYFLDPMFQENGYLLWTDETPEAWGIDPGFPPQAENMIAAIRERELELTRILITHAHLDHIAGVDELRAAFPTVRVLAPAGEAHMLPDPVENLSAQCGLNVSIKEADETVEPGTVLSLGEIAWNVLDVRGHSPNGLAFHSARAGVVFTGDALFAGSVGRMDFPGGSEQLLLGNIREHLLTLPDDTEVYSGHGPPTTIGQERDTNPYLSGGFA